MRLSISNCVLQRLRGLAVILFISRATFSDSIAKLFVLVFLGYRTSIARYVAQWGIALMCLCKIRHQGGIASYWGIAGMAEKVSRDRGYRSDTIAISRDMGPLSAESWYRTPAQSVFFSERHTGPNFIHPHPPTPENTLLGAGGV